MRIFFLHHVTWSINSIWHFYGKRPFETTDFSTNSWVLSLISFGESWHNNHHAFPTSARHGLGKGQVDISASLITLLAKVGLARGVKVATPKQLAKRVIRGMKMMMAGRALHLAGALGQVGRGSPSDHRRCCRHMRHSRSATHGP